MALGPGWSSNCSANDSDIDSSLSSSSSSKYSSRNCSRFFSSACSSSRISGGISLGKFLIHVTCCGVKGFSGSLVNGSRKGRSSSSASRTKRFNVTGSKQFTGPPEKARTRTTSSRGRMRFKVRASIGYWIRFPVTGSFSSSILEHNFSCNAGCCAEAGHIASVNSRSKLICGNSVAAAAAPSNVLLPKERCRPERRRNIYNASATIISSLFVKHKQKNKKFKKKDTQSIVFLFWFPHKKRRIGGMIPTAEMKAEPWYSRKLLTQGAVARLPVAIQRQVIERFLEPCEDATHFGERCSKNSGFYENRQRKVGESEQINCFQYCLLSAERCSATIAKVLTDYPNQVRLRKPGREQVFNITKPPSLFLHNVAFQIASKEEEEEESEVSEPESEEQEQETGENHLDQS